MRRRLKVMGVALVGTAVLAGAAAAATSPSVTTGGTSGVGQTTATLHGTVNPNGSSTTYLFQWGLTNGYGDASTAKSAGNGTAGLTATQGVHALIPGTIYHYRLVATNGAGTSVGADRTFKTAGHPPPGVATGPATQLSTSGATLTGTVNPSGDTTSWWFEWGSSTNYTQQTVHETLASKTLPENVAASLQGLLAPGTIYHYRLTAGHSSGPATAGADGTFMTYPSPRPVPRVTAATRPRRVSHRPYLLATSGRVAGPSWIPAQYACQGNVTIRFFRGLRQVRFTLAGVQRNCTFSAQTLFPGLPGHSRPPVRLRVVIRFITTNYLATNRAGYEQITLG
jgi:phosphodiesterase/alkaline phosphatase D-like protein